MLCFYASIRVSREMGTEKGEQVAFQASKCRCMCKMWPRVVTKRFRFSIESCLLISLTVLHAQDVVIGPVKVLQKIGGRVGLHTDKAGGPLRGS